MTRRPTARAALAVLLVEMAAGQVSDVSGFARILGTYQVLPGRLLVPSALALSVAEASAGVLLLRRHPAGGRLAVFAAAAWSALALAAFARRLPLDNCGCFGVHLGQPLRWWVLLEDAGFLALALWVNATQCRGGPAAPGLRRPTPSLVEE